MFEVDSRFDSNSPLTFDNEILLFRRYHSAPNDQLVDYNVASQD